MRSAIVENGVVVNVIIGEIEGSIECGPEIGIGWSYDGEIFHAPAAPEPDHPSLENYEDAIQSHVDAIARERLFRDGVTLASYVASTNAAWAEQAQVFVAWRDAVWAYAYAELAKALSGAREIPTVEAFLTELPAIVWPE